QKFRLFSIAVAVSVVFEQRPGFSLKSRIVLLERVEMTSIPWFPCISGTGPWATGFVGQYHKHPSGRFCGLEWPVCCSKVLNCFWSGHFAKGDFVAER